MLRVALESGPMATTFASKLNEQIGYEFAASQQYIAVAVYYDSQSLPQLAVCSYNEIVPGVGVETLAVLGPQRTPVGVA